MASGPSAFIVDADLHGLVDGHIEPDRRADALRRLASSPSDRARVEAWQSQNDLLRSTFAGLDREPLPAMLDLTTKPRLQCIPAKDPRLVGPVGGPARAAPRRGGFGLAVVTIVLIATGVVGTWLVLDSAETDGTMAPTIRSGSVDAMLASRSAQALAAPRPTPANVPPQAGDRLPTTQIPDLRATGFSFVGAEIEASDPVSMLFRYQNSGAERLVISVARAAALPESATRGALARIGDAYTWHKRDNVFALAGTLRAGRLRAIAVTLQNDDARD